MECPQPKGKTGAWKAVSIPAWGELLIVIVLSLMVSMVNDKLCLIILGSSSMWLVLRHRKSPATVVGIIFAIACAAPLLRRVHDLRFGFVKSSGILIAPFCAYPVLGVLLLRNLPSLGMGVFVPVVLTSTGIIWAYCVGLINAGIFPASIQLLQYASCMVIYFYVVVHSDEFRMETFHKWILWIGALEAAYGLFQWASPPAWDVAWFNATDMGNAAGMPLPFMMRTFGTLNSVSHFSSFLFFVLVVAVEARGFLWAGPIVVGGLASTLVRTLWGGTAIGWLVTLLVAEAKVKIRVALSVGGTLLIMGVFAIPFSDRLVNLSKRFDSLTSIKKDGSFNDRSALMVAAITGGVLDDPIGIGLGGSGAAARVSSQGLAGIDNGFIQMFLLFGWIGTFLYLSGLFWGVARSFSTGLVFEPGRVAFLGVVVALFAASAMESSFEDLKGVMLWLSIGILNAPRSSQSQRTAGRTVVSTDATAVILHKEAF